MARVVRNQEDYHALTIRGDENDGRTSAKLTLVMGGRLAYVAAACNDNGMAFISGPATLRALAKAILREVPEPRRRKRGK